MTVRIKETITMGNVVAENISSTTSNTGSSTYTFKFRRLV